MSDFSEVVLQFRDFISSTALKIIYIGYSCTHFPMLANVHLLELLIYIQTVYENEVISATCCSQIESLPIYTYTDIYKYPTHNLSPNFIATILNVFVVTIFVAYRMFYL